MEAEVTMRAALTLIVVFQISRMQALTFPSEIKWVDIKSMDDLKPKANERVNKLVYLDNFSRSGCAAQCSNRANCSSFFYNERIQSRNCILSESVYVNTLRVTNSQAGGFVYYEISNDGCPVNHCYHQLRQEDLCLFLHVGSSFSYRESDQLCKSIYGHLAVLDGKKKSAAFFEFLKINIDDPLLYVGAIRVNGSFKWANGNKLEETDQFWFSGEPNSPHEKCALVNNRKGKVGGNDVDCTVKAKHVLCEKD